MGCDACFLRVRQGKGYGDHILQGFPIPPFSDLIYINMPFDRINKEIDI